MIINQNLKELRDQKDLKDLKTEGGKWATEGEYYAHGLKYNGKEINLLTEVVEQDDDVIKMGHFVIDAKTKEKLRMIDWSPYSQPDFEDITLYVNLGCPNRIGYGPLDKKDLIVLKKSQELQDEIKKVTKEHCEVNI